MSIRNSLIKTFGRNYNNLKGEVGLEIETESLQDYLVPKFSFWDMHQDGSLRNIGREYVLKQPLGVETELSEALKEFSDKTKDIKFVPDSITTSVHVHVNMLNETFVTLGNFLTLYTLVENLLIRYSGEDRKSNLFCLPICDAEEIYQKIVHMMQGIGKKNYSAMGFAEDDTKYGALNLAALSRLGSLEIRSFRGTTDMELIERWVRILYAILKYARQGKLVPPQIILAYKDKGLELLTDVFGEYREDIRVKEEERLVEKNFWYAASIAYSIRNWDKLEEVPKPKKAKPKDIEAIAQTMYAMAFEALNFEQQSNVIHRANQPITTPTDTTGVFTAAATTAWRDTPVFTPRRPTTRLTDLVFNEAEEAQHLPATDADGTPDWVRDIRRRLARGDNIPEHEMEELWAWEDENGGDIGVDNEEVR